MNKMLTDLDALRTAAEPIKLVDENGLVKEEGAELIKKLTDALITNEKLVCITAPQIGINKRAFAIKFNDTVKVFMNPIITKKIGSTFVVETFNSMPGKEILIARPEEIQAVYYTENFSYEDNKLVGPAAKMFDQLAQSLDGVLPDELGLVSDVEHDGTLLDATDEEMKELIEMYKQFIKNKTDAYKNSLDDVGKQVYKKLKITEDVINGRITLVEPQKKTNRAQRRAAAKANKKKTR